jgi:hypothetical protein
MKSAEFDGTLARNGQLPVPRDLAKNVPAGETLQVGSLWNGEPADDAWRRAGREQFEDAYAPEDAIYERVIDETAAGWFR